MSEKKNWFKRHKVWTTVIVILLVIGFIGAVTDNNAPQTANSAPTSSPSTSNSNKPVTTTSSVTPKLNEQANDGKLGFTVTNLKCGVNEISQPDTPDYTDTTGAPYCAMGISVKGISNVSQSFDSSSQYIYDTSGKQYSVDDTATIAANKSSNNCMMNPTVNPGVTITCTLVYDVPANESISYGMYHDSAASNGVKVSLSQ